MRTCTKCGYKSEAMDAIRCPLCKAPFSDAANVLNRLSQTVQESQSEYASPVRSAAPARRILTAAGLKVVLRLIAVMTFLHGIVGTLGICTLLLFVQHESLVLRVFFLDGIALLVRGVCGLLGAFFLWRGAKMGYQLTIACWGCNILVALIAVMQFPFIDISDPAMARHVGSTLGKLIFGIPITIFLTRKLMRWNSESMGDSSWEPEKVT